MEIYGICSRKEMEEEIVKYIEYNVEYCSPIGEEFKKILSVDPLGTFITTYAEVLDWLQLYYNIIISFEPAFTFATNDHVAYFYKVYKVNNKEAKLDLLFEEKEWMSSFKLAIKDIVKKLIEEKYIK